MRAARWAVRRLGLGGGESAATGLADGVTAAFVRVANPAYDGHLQVNDTTEALR